VYNYHQTESDTIKYYPGGITKKQAEAKRKKWFQLFDVTSSFFMAIVIILLCFTFIFRIANVDGRSMMPTLYDGDWLVVSGQQSYERGDIIIITQPNDMHEPLVKRVIALGGEKININFATGEVFINDELISEPYIKEATNRSFDVAFPYVVPEGCVFAMGDNRNDSLDSRSSRVGCIDERYILGKAVFRILPITDFKHFTDADKD
jgi:signal peptidase I